MGWSASVSAARRDRRPSARRACRGAACGVPHERGLLCCREALAHLGECRRVGVGDRAVQLTVHRHQGADRRAVGRCAREGRRAARMATARRVSTIFSKEGRWASTKPLMRPACVGSSFASSVAPEIAGDGRVDRVAGVAHGGGVLEVEGAEVGAVALGTEVGVGLDGAGVPAEHVAGVGHHGFLLVAG